MVRASHVAMGPLFTWPVEVAAWTKSRFGIVWLGTEQ
jgi:hypothetical protein